MVTVLLWPSILCAQAPPPAEPVTEPAREVRVRVEAEANARACPGREVLEAALQPLFVDTQITVSVEQTGSPEASTAQIAVLDRGESYVVNVGGATRTVVDAARDCVERARVTAVFAALNLHAAPAGPAPEPTQPVATEPTVEPPLASGDDAEVPRSGVALSLFSGAQLPTSDGQLTAGAGLGVAWVSGAWRVGADATWLSGFTLALSGDASSVVPDARVRTTRLPLAVSATHLVELGAVSIGPSLGAVLDVMWMRGEQVMRPQRETRLNVGARVSLEGRVHFSRAWHGLLQLGAWAYPRAYRLSVAPSGEEGRTPRLWIGASLGLEWQLGEFDTAD